MRTLTLLLATSALVATAGAQDAAPAKLNARLMQMPAVSTDQIAFVYAGDIWLAPRAGGAAFRLSSPRGAESFPRFSPDGQWLAFTGNYDGNEDVYVLPVTGGEPRRVTHHGARDRLLGWYPDGKSLIFASNMVAFTERVNQFFKVSAQGGMPEVLPVPYGEFGAISADGKQLAYTPITTDFSTWKRYRGGMAPDIWLFDLEKRSAEKIAPDPAIDTQPMWHGSTKVYFLSDRDDAQRDNLWVYDTESKVTRQVTHYTDSDVHFPSIGPDAIVYENGGRLFLFDLATEQAKEVEIGVVTDQATVRPRIERVGGVITNGMISPTGKRALFEARGEIFSVPAEHGVVRNLTESSGVAERYPAWSPDGKWIAYFSDRSGEYELTLRPADGKGPEQIVTQLGAGFRYQPFWSPDSKQVVFIDSAMKLWRCDIAEKRAEVIDRQLWLYHKELESFRVSWSADSRWIAYAGDLEHQQSGIVLFDTKEKKRHLVTTGFFEDDKPVFDPDGKYLYYRTKRWFKPIYSEFEPSWIYANAQALVAVPLKKDGPSPLAPRNDEETGEKKKDDDKKPEEKKGDKPTEEKREEPKKETLADGEPSLALEEKKPDAPKAADPKPDEKKPEKPEDKKPKAVEIDIEGFESRGVVLPPTGGRFGELFALPGKVFFTKLPRAGSTATAQPLAFYDLEKREEKQVVDDCGGLELSADGKKLLVAKSGTWAIIKPEENQKLDKPLATSGLEMSVEPRAEWRQLFSDAWRIERDFFYDPGLHGVDWKAMRERYGKLIDAAVTRWDVNHIIGELLGELSVSHAYRSGGDVEGGNFRPVGYLGCDFALEQGAYRIVRIPEVAPWEITHRSPLRAPGVNVKAGDWLLAINGRPLDPSRDPWAALQGLADKTVMLSVNDKPSLEGAREVLVQTSSSERLLRHYAWMDANRRRVEELSAGKVGYIYVRDTGQEGQSQLYRQFRAQFMKPGLIIDERWNAGGQIPDRFIELLARKVANYWGVRDGRDWQTPAVAHSGPKAMLTNGWSGSGGDAFPWLFRENKLGPLIGTRTWGGLIGMTGAPGLIDGGSVTVPTFSIYSRTGEWIIENQGVAPDIEVIDDPSAMSQGADPQLDRAIQEVVKTLDAEPPASPKRPAYRTRIVRDPAPPPPAEPSAVR